MVKFLHMADSHNGYSGNASRYNEYAPLRIDKTTEDNINVRQHDINVAFRQCIDKAIDEKVDFVVHAGDLFDFWGYKQPLVYTFVQQEIARLKEHGIQFIVVIGNHDLPKIAGKGTYLESLSHMDHVHAVYKGFYETIEFPEHNVVFHCVPSTFTQDVLNESLAMVQPVPGKINIGVGHFGVTTIKHYAENAINSLVVDLDTLIKCNMDYFALGDYHTTTDFGHNIRYSGSTDRFGFGELQNDPKVLLVEIDGEVRVREEKLNVRPMIEIPSIDAKGKTPEEVNGLIQKRISQTNVKDSIVRFRVKNIKTSDKKLIDSEKVKELFQEALYYKFELVDKVTVAKGLKTAGTKFEGVLEGFPSFIDQIADDGTLDREQLKKKGMELLAEVYEDYATR